MVGNTDVFTYFEKKNEKISRSQIKDLLFAKRKRAKYGNAWHCRPFLLGKKEDKKV